MGDGTDNHAAGLEARHTARHDALLDAALGLLAARQGRMLTIEEWASLARAVARCHRRKAAEYLTDDDLADIADGRIDWDEAADGPLPEMD